MPPCPRACRNARVDYEKYAEDCEQKVSDQSARICIIKRLVGARVWGAGSLPLFSTRSLHHIDTPRRARAITSSSYFRKKELPFISRTGNIVSARASQSEKSNAPCYKGRHIPFSLGLRSRTHHALTTFYVACAGFLGVVKWPRVHTRYAEGYRHGNYLLVPPRARMYVHTVSKARHSNALIVYVRYVSVRTPRIVVCWHWTCKT